MRNFIIGIFLGVLLGSAGTLLAHWSDTGTGVFQESSIEQRLYRDFAPAPPLVPIAPLPRGTWPPASYRSPC